jgi:hypothetical protein
MGGMVPVGIGAVMNRAKALGMVVQKVGMIGTTSLIQFMVPDRATTPVPLQWEALTRTLSDHLATPSIAELRVRRIPSLDVPAAAIPLRRKIFTEAASTRPLFPAEDAIVEWTDDNDHKTTEHHARRGDGDRWRRSACGSLGRYGWRWRWRWWWRRRNAWLVPHRTESESERRQFVVGQ